MAQNMNQANISLLDEWRAAGNTGDLPVGWSGSGGGGGGGQDVNSILQNAIDAITGKMASPPTPYSTVNPFSFDEQLAREASTAEYSPYYDEMLSDYVANIQTKTQRSEADLKSTLDFLNTSKDYFTGTQRRLLDKATRASNEGFAGKGLFFSGAREKDIKELGIESEATTNEYLSGYQYKTSAAKTDQSRTVEDLALAEKQQTRDTEREKQYAIEGGVLTRKGEAREEYEAGRTKYYENYPNYSLYG